MVGRSLQPMFTKIVKLWLLSPSHRTLKAEIKVCGIEDICPEFLAGFQLLEISLNLQNLTNHENLIVCFNIQFTKCICLILQKQEQYDQFTHQINVFLQSVIYLQKLLESA